MPFVSPERYIGELIGDEVAVIKLDMPSLFVPVPAKSFSSPLQDGDVTRYT